MTEQLVHASSPRRTESLVQRRARLLGPAYRHFYRNPVHVVRGKGVFLYDEDGNEYLDAYNNVVPAGHGNTRVADAVARQMATLCTHTRYLQDNILDYAEELIGLFGGEISAAGHVMFTCTGSEANDLALRIARNATGSNGVIITQNAYHGNSLMTAALSPSLGQSFVRSDWVRMVPAPDSYRAANLEDVVRDFSASVEAQIQSLKQAGQNLAALIIDSFFTSDGIYSDPKKLLAPVVGMVRAAGGLIIMDEVQTGFGRTGDSFWGYQRYGIDPDIVTMGKPMGNGYPVAGLAVTATTAKRFGESTRYFNTFGGSTAAIAAAQATLDIIRDERLQQNAQSVGGVLKGALEALRRKYEMIGDVRGQGLYVGAEIVSDPITKTPAPALANEIVNGLRNRGVLISATGVHGNCLKIRPPLVFSESNVDRLVSALTEMLNAVDARSSSSKR